MDISNSNSGDAGNSSRSTGSPQAGDQSSPTTNLTDTASWGNATLPGNWSHNSFMASTPIDPSTTPLPSASLSNATTNLTSSDLAATTTNSSSPIVPDSLPSLSAPAPSATPPVNPNVMGHARLDSSMFQAPGLIIGVGCSILGVMCILLGLAMHIRKRRQSKAVRRLRVMSGFDFNDGAEEEYHNIIWDKAHQGSNEKFGLGTDGPLTEMNSYRNSNITVYSNADEEDSPPTKPSTPNLSIQTGFAQ